MPIKVKKAGAYVDPVGVFAKKNGTYSAIVGLSAKSGGAYVLASSSPAKVAAQRVIASNTRGLTPITQVMASPPTVVNGSTNNSLGNNYSAYTGQAQPFSPYTPVALTGSNLGANWAGTTQQFGNTRASSTGNPASKRAGPGGFRVRTTGQHFEFCSDNTYKYMVYVTNPTTGVRERIAVNDLSGPGSGFGLWPRIAFSSAADRIIEVFGGVGGTSEGALVIRGLDGSAGVAITAPSFNPLELRVLIVGDSHSDHTGSSNTNSIRYSLPDFFAERLGTANIWCSAAGGRGFLNPGSYATYRSGIVTAGDIDPAYVGDMDVVVLAGTTNDDLAMNAAYTDVAIQAEVQLAVAAAMLKQPKALIVVHGPLGRTLSPSPNAHVTPQSRYDAIKAGVIAAAAGDKRVIYIDNSPSGTPWVTAGNQGTYLGADGTHLTNAGMSGCGYAFATALLAACAAI